MLTIRPARAPDRAQMLDWNTPSIRFYEALGARWLPEWITMRVEGAALATLAGS